MFWNYIFQNFFLIHKNKVIIYIILNLIIYPIETLYLSKLYSHLINKSKDVIVVKKLKMINNETILDSIKKKNVKGLILFIGIVLIILSLVDKARNYIYSIINAKFRTWIRNEIFKQNIIKLNTDYKDIKIGKEIMKMEDIISMVKDMINATITTILSISLIIIIVGIYLFYLNFNIGIVFVVLIVIYIFVLFNFYNKINYIIQKRVILYYEIGNNISNSYLNLANILSNNKSNYEIKKNNIKSNEYTEICLKSYIISTNILLTCRIIFIVIFLSIILIAFNLLLKKKINNIEFTTCVIIMIYFSGILFNNNLKIINWIDCICMINNHKEYLDKLFGKNNDKNNIKNNITNGKIEFRNLTYKYSKSNKYVIRNLNFTVEPKQKVAILGKSGSGKSTLMKLLIKFYKPNNGKIFIDDTNIQNIDTTYLRDNITYINQNTILFDEDIYYNIKYGSKKSINLETIAPAPSPNQQPLTNLTPSISNKVYPKEEILEDSKIKKILKKYDLLTIYDKLENKLRTKAGPRGTNLSLGMQKVTITLRGILKKSKVIIFDEPLAGLDQLTREKIIKLIMNETKDKTVIIITHDKEILPYMDKTINLQEIND